MLTNKGGMICRHLSLSLAFSRFHFVCSLSYAALSAPSITRKKRKSIRLSMLDGGLKGITTTGRRSRNGHAKPNHGNSRCSRVFTRGDFIMMAYSADAVQQRDCFDMLLTSQKEVSAYTTKLTFVDAGASIKIVTSSNEDLPWSIKAGAPVQTKKGENMDTNTAQQLDDTRKVRMRSE